jgi:hypothetical protein
MEVTSILAAIDSEISTLEKARLLLLSLDGGLRGAPAPAKQVRKRRKLSAKARKAIADAQRKRWAAAKGAVKTAPIEATKKTAPSKAAPKKKRATRKLSVEGKKRIAAAQKKRWAAIKAKKKSATAAAAANAAKKTSARKAAFAKEAAPRKASPAKAKKATAEKAAPATTAVMPS